MSLFNKLQKNISYIFVIVTLLYFGAYSCGNENGSTVSKQSSDVEASGTDISACLNGDAVDFATFFSGPCTIHPGEDDQDTQPTDTISYSDLLTIVLDESGAEGQSILDCVAKEAYCTGETQCLSVASICQFAANCGDDSNPCEEGTGPCHADLVDTCRSVTNKSDCNNSYQGYCFDSSGGFVSCTNPNAPVVQQDFHNCFWGVDSSTNLTGCYSYGESYGDSACTPQ